METNQTGQTSHMPVQPQKEHQWLQKLVGEWTYETEGLMEPEQPPVKSTGTETVRSLGGLWILAEGQGEMPGCGPATTLMALGYDPQKQRFRREDYLMRLNLLLDDTTYSYLSI
ncbi:Protein of unknown function (DUF1579) [Allocoleopsis franciscana PCC 7113]|uniref:DUF1579 domain-containing protein n=1 Tax=Allocoleopsis franciscana PCC 7113 TaxID=1173027 RepID=K9WGA9_9CYAN|nr:Protein of unknown function (DUF1579) [Allocoleopsis franciscana PCC 7113]